VSHNATRVVNTVPPIIGSTHPGSRWDLTANTFTKTAP